MNNPPLKMWNEKAERQREAWRRRREELRHDLRRGMDGDVDAGSVADLMWLAKNGGNLDVGSGS